MMLISSSNALELSLYPRPDTEWNPESLTCQTSTLPLHCTLDPQIKAFYSGCKELQQVNTSWLL